MAIRHTDRRRLARLAGPCLREERHALEERVALRWFFLRVAILLAAEEVDPETTCIAERYREAEAALAAIPDTPELAKADAAYLARSDARWSDEGRPRRRYEPRRLEDPAKSAIERLMSRFRTDCEINFADASPMELYAWCLSRQQGESYEEAAAAAQKTAKNLLLRLGLLPHDPAAADIERADLAEETQ
jgi:hypothetical protein